MQKAARVAIYARISEDRQGLQAGVTRQLADARELAAARGWEVVDEFTDNDVSAFKGKGRQSYSELVDRVRAGKYDAIVVWHTSRLWRNRRERADGIELLREHAVSLVPVKGTELDLSSAMGRMVAGILGEFDTAESEVKGERIRRAAEQRSAEGSYHGGMRPFGYARDGMQVNEAEATELARMYDQLLGGIPIGAIVRDLTARGVPTVTGAAWATRTVRGILMRPRNAGLSVSRGEVVGDAKWPPVVSRQVWEAACALLSDPSRRTSTGNRASYLLSGIARCGVCGGPMTSGGIKRSSAIGYRRQYRCRAGYHVTRRLDWIDQHVEEAVVTRLSRADAIDLIRSEGGPDMAALRQEEHAVRTRLDEVAAAFADGAITIAQLRTSTERLRARLAEISAVMAPASLSPVLSELVSSDDVGAMWASYTLEKRRAVVKAVMTVVVHPGGMGQRAFDPNCVTITWKHEPSGQVTAKAS